MVGAENDGEGANLILDVGSGDVARGDVNVDRYVSASIHRGFEINPHEINNFMLADAAHLPFRNDCFDSVVSSHVIEHVNEPMRMLSEMARVSSRFVEVRCPHRLCLERNKAHKNKMCPSWFRKAFAILGLRVVLLDVKVGLFGLPVEITACAKKIHRTVETV